MAKNNHPWSLPFCSALNNKILTIFKNVKTVNDTPMNETDSKNIYNISFMFLNDFITAKKIKDNVVVGWLSEIKIIKNVFSALTSAVLENPNILNLIYSDTNFDALI
jgi:hypothetical protein